MPLNLEVLENQPVSEDKPTPILFVHGAWHGAWCWQPHFLPYFGQHGYKAYAVSLRGHGNSEADKAMMFNGIHDYLADMAQVADDIQQKTGQRPIIIGHSMGGYIAQKYLEKHTAPAAILLASIPVMGTIPFQVRLLLYHTIPTLKTLVTMNGYHIVGTPKLAKKLFFSKTVSEETIHKYHAQLQNESIRILLDAGLFNRPSPKNINATKMLVIAAENDKVFTLEEEKKTATAYQQTLITIPDIAHDVMLDTGWQTVADTVIKWLAENNL